MATQIVENEVVENEAIVKNLRAIKSNSDVENLFRFISENNLRKETHMIFTQIVNHLNPPKKKRKRKTKVKAKAKAKATLH
jgi:hypothetical protein